MKKKVNLERRQGEYGEQSFLAVGEQSFLAVKNQYKRDGKNWFQGGVFRGRAKVTKKNHIN